MLQNATPLRKSAPWPPNISHEHVFCTAPTTENASFQILFKCPTPAIVFGHATKPSRFSDFWQGAHNPLRRPREAPFRHLNFKKCSGPGVLCAFWLGNVIRPHWRALFRHLNFQKCPENGVLCALWLGNVLRATTACTFSTSQLLKALRSWGALYILTWKFASRHNGVQFFISHLPRRLRTHLLFDPPEPQIIGEHSVSRLCYLFAHLHLLSSDLTLSLLWSFFFSSLLWLFTPLLFHLSILSEVWLLNFLRQ